MSVRHYSVNDPEFVDLELVRELRGMKKKTSAPIIGTSPTIDKTRLDWLDKKLFHSGSGGITSLILVSDPPSIKLNGTVLGNPADIRKAIDLAAKAMP